MITLLKSLYNIFIINSINNTLNIIYPLYFHFQIILLFYIIFNLSYININIIILLYCLFEMYKRLKNEEFLKVFVRLLTL